MATRPFSRRLLEFALRFSARHRLPWLAALLLCATYSVVHGGNKGAKRYRVLALSLNKPGVLHDVEETFSTGDNFGVIRWPDYTLAVLASIILSPSLNNKSYQSADAAVEKTKKEYREFLKRLVRYHSAIRPIHAAISPNYGYYVQREFGAALEEGGTPFIVIHKESRKSSGSLEYWSAVYKNFRGKFTGRKILVYSETERELQVSSGVTTSEKIVVTGMPRLDRIHNWRRTRKHSREVSSQRQVVFFAFDRRDKLPMSQTKLSVDVENRWGELDWGSLCEKTHLAMVQIARQRPDINVIIKTKANARQGTEVIQMLTTEEASLPPNLKIVTGGDPFELLTRSQVVVGFNTTGQLESLAAGIPVITPWFDEAIAPKNCEFVTHLGNSVEYARSPEEIVKLACKFVDRPAQETAYELSSNVRQTLVQWTGNDDGGASRRVLAVIRREIECATH